MEIHSRNRRTYVCPGIELIVPLKVTVELMLVPVLLSNPGVPKRTFVLTVPFTPLPKLDGEGPRRHR